jgi:pimeloyl-ACP methyl ester carboxylesterase
LKPAKQGASIMKKSLVMASKHTTRRDVLTSALAASVAGTSILAAGPVFGQAATFSTVTSADGTKIAFERRGSGPALILIGGALTDRKFPYGVPLADLLASNFTVYAYDRRGRGDSADTAPFAVQREVEDLAALIAEAGAPVFVFGHSSGAILALEAVAAKLPISKLAVYEPPFNMDADAQAQNNAFSDQVAALLKDGKKQEAVIFFLTGIGMPPEMIGGMQQSPMWLAMLAAAPTLNYDMAITNAAIKSTTVPLLAMAGGASPDFVKQAVHAVEKAARHSAYLEIPGQTHFAPTEVVAPLLENFFHIA